VSGGVAGVQARIAEIRAYVEPAVTAAPAASTATAGSTATSTASAAATATSGTDFAAALAQIAGTGTATGADLSTLPTGALSSTVTGQDLVESAKKYLGTPYVWGGESLDEGGLDCSGLVLRSLADLGITSGVPRVARDQATLGQEVASLDQALPGDLVVLSGGKHIGIYVGDGRMIDAPKPGQSVTIRDVYAEPTTIRRVLPQAATGASAVAAPVAGSSAALSSALASTTAGQNALALLTGPASSGAAGSTTSSLLSSLWGAAS
jgi:cell wall-associated NlpC family hydrolase